MPGRRVVRLDMTVPVSSYWVGIAPDTRGKCCGDRADAHMVTVRRTTPRSIKCSVEHCPCKTWDDGWQAAASAPSVNLAERHLRVVE